MINCYVSHTAQGHRSTFNSDVFLVCMALTSVIGIERKEQGEQGCPHRGMACEPDLTFYQAEEEEEQTLRELSISKGRKMSQSTR